MAMGRCNSSRFSFFPLLMSPRLLAETLRNSRFSIRGRPVTDLHALEAGKVGPVTARLFERTGAPPLGDFGVVAADQNFGDFPAAKIGRTRIVRIIQQPAIFRKRFVQCSGLGLLRALKQTE